MGHMDIAWGRLLVMRLRFRSTTTLLTSIEFPLNGERAAARSPPAHRILIAVIFPAGSTIRSSPSGVTARWPLDGYDQVCRRDGMSMA